MCGTRNCKAEGLGLGVKSLLLVPQSCSGHRERVSRGHYLKITTGEKRVEEREVGAADAHPTRLSNSIPLGQATYPQLPSPRPTGHWEDARELLPHCSCTKEIEHF